MEEAHGCSMSSPPELVLSHDNGQRSIFNGHVKKRGLASRSWIKIDKYGNSQVVTLDKASIMRYWSLPSRDLRLLDPMFIYPSSILGRERAIVVNLEQIRCIITADEVFLMNSLDECVRQYRSELCNRLQQEKSDDLPFEFWALELALELTCTFLDPQVNELEMEVYPVLDELASSISTLNLERVRGFKGHLLALTQRVQKQLMDDDGDKAEMCRSEKKRRSDPYSSNDLGLPTHRSGRVEVISKSAPASPDRSVSGFHMLQRAFSSIGNSSQHEILASSDIAEEIEPLEMLLEAYFIVIDNTLTKSLSTLRIFGFAVIQLKEYIDDTEDFINIKLNQLIQFQLLLNAATLIATVFATVTAVFGMNFQTSVFDDPYGFNLVVIISGIAGAVLYFSFIVCFRCRKLLPA